MTPASSIALIVDQYVLVRLRLAQWMEWLSLEILYDLLENTGWSSWKIRVSNVGASGSFTSLHHCTDF
jgi:hypothetical protein